ncbi:unnamed protein product, partial [Rotaria sp. Silwood1]
LDLTSSLEILIELYVRCILLGQTTTEYNELYIRLIEHNFKLTKIHAYASCLFLLESDEADLYSLSIDYLVLILARIYTLLQQSNENTNSLNNEHVNEEQEIIDSSSIISSSDNILIELVAELYQRTKQSSTLSYEASYFYYVHHHYYL